MPTPTKAATKTPTANHQKIVRKKSQHAHNPLCPSLLLKYTVRTKGNSQEVASLRSWASAFRMQQYKQAGTSEGLSEGQIWVVFDRFCVRLCKHQTSYELSFVVLLWCPNVEPTIHALLKWTLMHALSFGSICLSTIFKLIKHLNQAIELNLNQNVYLLFAFQPCTPL